IRILASTKFITSSFWRRCQEIDILNNFLFKFLEVLNYFYLFIYLFLLYSKNKIVLNFQFHYCLDLCLLFICACKVGGHLTRNSLTAALIFVCFLFVHAR
ncbi:hypothetical protein ACMBCN_03060, partial [Candidatus Liberibacter asiaticus]|nr:hypothetical protein [Candidatus Liberibacter asiaticus]